MKIYAIKINRIKIVHKEVFVLYYLSLTLVATSHCRNKSEVIPNGGAKL
jgi:hypothetical protein